MLQVFDSLVPRQWYLDDENVLWVHGTLLAKQLGFSNPGEAIRLHTDPDERCQPSSLQNMPTIPWFVSESGMWKMALVSKTKEAKEFRQKLTREILPSIRKTGQYLTEDRKQQIKQLFNSILDNQEILLRHANTVEDLCSSSNRIKIEVLEQVLWNLEADSKPNFLKHYGEQLKILKEDYQQKKPFINSEWKKPINDISETHQQQLRELISSLVGEESANELLSKPRSSTLEGMTNLEKELIKAAKLDN